jgi:hypothetical protein
MKLAECEYATMQAELAKVMDSISFAKTADIKVWEAISEFVARFP